MTHKTQTNRARSGRLTLTATALALAMGTSSNAQTADTASAFKPKGTLWGAAFGDAAWKAGSDQLNRGANQYTSIPLNSNLFQWRRVYLGYKYDISGHFIADFLLSAENDYAAGVLGQSANSVNPTTGAVTMGNNGDILLNNKFAPFVKWANLRWKNIWKGTDLVLGQGNTPAIGITGRNSQTSEEVWAYRSLEKTMSDVRGTPVYDMGATLQGWFDETGNYGYDVMVGNGQAARPENDQYKWFYADVYAKFFNKRLVIDLYQDYEKLNWGVYTKGPNGNWYHDRNMTKLFAAWNTEKLTIGFEGFRNTILGDIKVTGIDNNTYYRTSKAIDMSFFIWGRILKNSEGKTKLGYFFRYDNYDPSGDIASVVSDPITRSFTNVTTYYDPTTKEQYLTAGLDFTPRKNIHFMPNFMLNDYYSTIGLTKADAGMNPGITGIKATDVIWRLTFYYVYGK